MNFDNYKIRCSSIGAIMTNQPGKKDALTVNDLSETCKAKLIECYVAEVYGREKDINSKYIAKGLQAEEDSLTLYSRVNKKIFFKNEERFSNDYICGTPDIIDGETVIDIKTSWDLYTFFGVRTKGINKDYYYQLLGYMDLVRAYHAKLAYCLVDTPEPLINDEKRKLMYDMGATTSESPEYLKACEEIDKSMRFGDIAMNDKVYEFKFSISDEMVSKIYQRVRLCREFLNTFSAIGLFCLGLGMFYNTEL